MARLAELQLNPFAAATAAGLQQSFLNDIIRGRKRTVKSEYVGRMAEALQMPVEDFLERTGLRQPSDHTVLGQWIVRGGRDRSGSAATPAVDMARLRVLMAAAFEARDLTEPMASALTEALIALARPCETALEPAQLQALARALALGLR